MPDPSINTDWKLTSVQARMSDETIYKNLFFIRFYSNFSTFPWFWYLTDFKLADSKKLNIWLAFVSKETSLPFLRAHRVTFPQKPTAVKHHPHSNVPTHAVEHLPTQLSMCGCYYSTGWMFQQVPLVITACHKRFTVCIFLWWMYRFKFEAQVIKSTVIFCKT